MKLPYWTDRYFMYKVKKMKNNSTIKQYKNFIIILSIQMLFIGMSCSPPPYRECRGPRCYENMRSDRNTLNRDGYRSDLRSSYDRYGPNQRSYSGRQYSDEAIDYFLEIGFGSELEDSKFFSLVDFFIETQLRSSFWEMQTRPVVKKWYDDLYIKLHENYTQEGHPRG